MTDRTKLRNQVTSGVGFGIYMVVRMFWNPFGPTSSDLKWRVRILFATAACVSFHLAWTKYFEYREKYPHDPLFKRQ